MDSQKERYREQENNLESTQNGLEKSLTQEQQATSGNIKQTKICPHCGAANDVSSFYCENCGGALESDKCPYCGLLLPPNADFCERCKHYIASDRCSFCGEPIAMNDSFCAECGAPRGGIVCPICHTHNVFSFCSSCGSPLTDIAKRQREQVQSQPYYSLISQMASELKQLLRTIPISTQGQKDREKRNEEIRSCLLTLLKQEPTATEPTRAGTELDKQALDDLIALKRQELQQLLEITKVEQQDNPVLARNYAMAHRPVGTSLGWRCNYKHALHAGPFECACPQLGGAWIILDGQKEKQLTKDF